MGREENWRTWRKTLEARREPRTNSIVAGKNLPSLTVGYSAGLFSWFFGKDGTQPPPSNNQAICFTTLRPPIRHFSHLPLKLLDSHIRTAYMYQFPNQNNSKICKASDSFSLATTSKDSYNSHFAA